MALPENEGNERCQIAWEESRVEGSGTQDFEQRDEGLLTWALMQVNLEVDGFKETPD